MHNRPRRILALLSAVIAIVFAAADWPGFRGPGGTGVSDQKGLPTAWGASKGIVWKTDLPGYGGSSPVVLGNQVILTCYSSYGQGRDALGEISNLTRHVVSCDLQSGKQLWNTALKSKGDEAPYQGFLEQHGYASSTPATDGQTVFVFLGRDGVAALTTDGKVKWQTSVGTKTDSWGTGTSPVLFENLVIVNASVESGALVALNKQSGSEVWRAPGIRRSWNTPLLIQSAGGSPELVVSSQGELLAFHPGTGEKLWSCKSIDDYICPSVVEHDGVVYATGGRRSMVVAVKSGGRGDVTGTHRLWEAAVGTNVPSPVFYEGHVYVVSDSRGMAYCLEAKSGKKVYEQRLDPRPDRIYASPLVADGKIYLVSHTKGAYVLAAQPKFQLLAHNPPLDDSVFNGSPAVANGKLLLRSNKALYCLGQE